MQVAYNIAGVGIRLDADALLHAELRKRYGPYVCADASAHFTLRVAQVHDMLEPICELPQIIRCDNELHIGNHNGFLMRLCLQSCVGTLQYRRMSYDGSPGTPPNAIDSALSCLVTAILSRERRGVLLHASSLRHDDRGYVFIGRSGAGKSTIASMVDSSSVHSDEFSALTADAQGLRLESTPFLSTLGEATERHDPPTPSAAHVGFTLRHDDDWRSVALAPQDAYRQLMTCVVMPAGCQQVAENAFVFSAEAIETMNWRRLHFTRNPEGLFPMLRQHTGPRT